MLGVTDRAAAASATRSALDAGTREWTLGQQGQDKVNHPGFRAYFLSWEGCDVDASQVQPGREGPGHPPGPGVYRPACSPSGTSGEPPAGSVTGPLTCRGRDVRHVTSQRGLRGQGLVVGDLRVQQIERGDG